MALLGCFAATGGAARVWVELAITRLYVGPEPPASDTGGGMTIGMGMPVNAVGSFKGRTLQVVRPPLMPLPFVEAVNLRYPHYKYIKRPFFETFMNDGILRIGTMFDFVQTEKHGARVGDESEGLIFSNSIGTGVALVCNIPAVNAYIYCVSSEKSAIIASEFEADFCFKINSVEFYLEITKVLMNVYPDIIATLAAVDYASAEEVSRYLNGLLPLSIYDPASLPSAARTKDTRYASQFEIRAIWEPRTMSDPFFAKAFQENPRLSWAKQEPYHSHQNAHLQPLLLRVPAARQFIGVENI